jgi:hypothetical protein
MHAFDDSRVCVLCVGKEKISLHQKFGMKCLGGLVDMAYKIMRNLKRNNICKLGDEVNVMLRKWGLSRMNLSCLFYEWTWDANSCLESYCF